MRTLVSGIVFQIKGASLSICSSMSVARTGIGDGRRRDALVGLVLLLLYPNRCRVKVRIHSRPRSDRKRRFLLSAVEFSTSTRHPREAKPINWSQRGGLACRPGNCVLTPRPHFTAPSCTLGNRVVGASDGPPVHQERRPTRVCRTPGAGSGLLAEASTPRARPKAKGGARTGTHEPVPTDVVDQAGCA